MDVLILAISTGLIIKNSSRIYVYGSQEALTSMVVASGVKGDVYPVLPLDPPPVLDPALVQGEHTYVQCSTCEYRCSVWPQACGMNTITLVSSLALRVIADSGCASSVDYRILSVTVRWAGPGDFNGDGDLGTDSDIEAFWKCLSGDCGAHGTADFNNDGDMGTDADIAAFYRALAGTIGKAQ